MLSLVKINRTHNGHLHRYLLGFEGYSGLFLVWAEDLADAIDWLGDHCMDHAPGLTHNAEVDAWSRENPDSDVFDWTDDENGYFLAGDSGAWFGPDLVCVTENPTRSQLARYK
jgi:hypothetical protein